MTGSVRLEHRGRVGVIIVNNPPVNAISQAVRRGLADCFATAAADETVEAIVLLCAGRTFIAGADIAEFDAPMGQPTCHQLFAVIESSAKPVVAAMHGTALGAGVETALACHYRLAAADARLGCPEINLGIVPGAGGTQRLPRIVGVRHAIEMFLTGKPVAADAALEMGLVDAISNGDLGTFAVRYAERLVDENRGPRPTAGIVIERDAATEEFLRNERQRVHRDMPGREVPDMVLDAVEAAIDLPFEQGIARETEISDDSLETVESGAMRRLFFAERATSKVPGIELKDARPVATGGVVGGGTMGRGIAMAFANADLPVVLLDVDDRAVAASLQLIRDDYRRRVDKGRLTEADLEARMALIRGTVDYSDFSDADVVIEAVFEVMALKKEIIGRLDAVCKRGAVLATNTSTLDVAEIAAATRRPQDVVGLHFFSPAHVMRLLEIVRTRETAADVLATSMALARTLRKIGVLAGNRYGFIGNRMMDPYGREAERMLLEGASPRRIDAALERFGMAMGILAVFDMAGVDVGYKVRQARQDFLPDDPGYYRSSAVLVEQGMLGQKTGAGFYRYEKGSWQRHDNPDALELFAAEAHRLGIEHRDISDEEIEQRCIFALINEGARVLEEGVALKASDVDVVYTSGYGFPRHRGGPMYYADTVGLGRVCRRIDEFGATLDPQYWQVSDLLRKLADSGEPIASFVS